MARVKDNFVGDDALLGNKMQTYETVDIFGGQNAIRKWHDSFQKKMREFNGCGKDQYDDFFPETECLE